MQKLDIKIKVKIVQSDSLIVSKKKQKKKQEVEKP